MKCKVSLLVTLIFVFTSAHLGDAFAQQTTTTVSARADLVLVNVRAERHGTHVPDLTRDSFTLLQDGKPQNIAVFEEVRTTADRLQTEPVAPGEFTNELRGDLSHSRYTIIAIDRINTSATDMSRLRAGLLKFLTEIASAGEPIRLISITPSRVDVVQDFTTDPRVLAVALEHPGASARNADSNGAAVAEFTRWAEMPNAGPKSPEQGPKSNVSAGEGIAASVDQQDQFDERVHRINSLEALQRIALSLAGIPGRKSLVWVSSGYRFDSVVRQSFPGGPTRLDFGNVIEALRLDEYTTHLLSAASIAVYPIDARGAVNIAYEAMDPSKSNAPAGSDVQYRGMRNRDVISSFESLALGTGGKACTGRADLSSCFRDALQDARDYYTLGYYIDRRVLQPGWHKIAVKVAEKGVSTRTRTGFLLSALSDDQIKANDLQLEAASRLTNPGLTFRGRWTGTTPKGTKKSAGFELTVPASAELVTLEQPRLNLDVVLLATGHDGSIAAQLAQHIERDLDTTAVTTLRKNGMTYRNALELLPGKYLVRIVIRDNNVGRIGSVSTVLDVD